MKEFIFEVRIQPSEKAIRDFHKAIAKALIDKYGVQVMAKVIEKAT